jgi:hypothetical protein
MQPNTVLSLFLSLHKKGYAQPNQVKSTANNHMTLSLDIGAVLLTISCSAVVF